MKTEKNLSRCSEPFCPEDAKAEVFLHKKLRDGIGGSVMACSTHSLMIASRNPGATIHATRPLQSPPSGDASLLPVAVTQGSTPSPGTAPGPSQEV